MYKKSIEVLVSTMNRGNLEQLELVRKMNLSTDAVIINQNQDLESIETQTISDQKINIVNTLDRGLSKSRNLAIQHASSDICLIADDDMIYHSDYEEKIIRAYEKYPEADIIAFQVKRVGNPDRVKKFRSKKNWENYITSMKISSVEITFRREKVMQKNLFFNPRIGAGTEFFNGEENVFLYEALRKKCRILYLPIEIAKVDMSESSWFEGYNKSYFETVGAKFFNMTSKYYILLMIQFSLRKYPLYKNDISLVKAFKYMKNGVIKYKEKFSN